MIDTEREAETQAEGEAGSMHQEPDVGFDPGSPGSRPGPQAGAAQKHIWKGIPGWLSGLAPAFGPGRDPGVLGLSPAWGSRHRAYFSLLLCLCLSLSLSLRLS